MIALEHLQVIDIIDTEGGFKRASEKLNKARSAVSYSVKLVEDYYQIEVFDRSGYRPKLTSDGKILLERIRALLRETESFDTFANQIKGETELVLRLGVSSIFPIEKITELLRELKQEFPYTTIHLNIEVGSGERLLKDDLVDIGIYGVLEKSSEVDYKEIDKLKLPLWISKDLPVENIKNVTNSELAKYPQVIVKSSYLSSPDFAYVDEAVKWFVTDNKTKRVLIESGLGWGRIPLHEVDTKKSKNLIRIKRDDEIDLQIYVAKLKNKALGPVAMKIWNYFN